MPIESWLNFNARLPLLPTFVAGVITAAALSSPAHADLVFGTNVVVNGNAEAGAGSSGSTTVAIPDWTTSDPVNGMTVVQYGSSAFPTVGSGPPDEGTNFFAGGVNNSSSNITQSLSVANQSTAINAGLVTFNFSAWLGGFSTQDDDATFSVAFENSSATTISTTTIGPVTEAERGGATELLPVSTTGVIPAGTVTLLFTLTATRFEGTFDDGYADDLSFVATNGTTVVTPPITTVPEPASMALLAIGLAGIGKVRRRRT